MNHWVVTWTASFLLLVISVRTRCEDRPAATDDRTLVPCSAANYRQFDFWVGDWDVFEVDRPNVAVAHARVELILNGCVLHEMYEGMDGHRGESFSIYDASRNVWHQSWVTNQGQLLTIEGQWRGDSMILHGVDRLPDGKARQVRGEWRRNDQGGVREIAARSTDGGVTWLPWFDLQFTPHRRPP